MLVVRPPLHATAVPIATDRIRLGMPHLGPRGLSEGWLLRELGDRHWQALATQLGRKASCMTDRSGNRVYAAFRSIVMEELDFTAAQEDGTLEVATSLARLSKTQVVSDHTLTLDGQSAGQIRMVSTFIRRETEGQNARVARTPVEGLDALPLLRTIDEGLIAKASALLPPERYVGTVAFAPCPQEDFNGAGFLYFPAYVAFANRACWRVLGARDTQGPLRQRKVAYFGNIDEGAGIIAKVEAPVVKNGGVRTRCLLVDSTTQRPLALVDSTLQTSSIAALTDWTRS
ncbi:MAG: hypothetical protein JWN07_3451 [Hyphomicrobiales bacterium]|nr:hypothetical protein [Hyphomicrobiales bacterium]